MVENVEILKEAIKNTHLKFFYRHLDYIHYNPIKHKLVTSLNDYKYTTFKKFVKLGLYEEDWCNFEDKNKIADLDFE